MIIVIGSHEDVRSAAVMNALSKKKAAFSLFNTLDFPYHSRLSLDIESTRFGAISTPSFGKVPMAEIRAVYYCLNNSFRMNDNDPPELHHIIYNNIDSAVWSFFRALDCLFINPIDPAQLHQYKGYLLTEFRKHGIRVPNTLITNDPEAVRAFYERNNRQVVCKPPWGQAFTEKLTDSHLAKDSLARLVNSPVMLQEYIPGQDFRAYVLKDKVFGVEVQSTTLDLNLDDTAKRVAVTLPDHIVNDCYKIAEVAGLVFTAIDFRVTPDGEHVFFEANSSPDFTTDEAWTGCPLSSWVADALIAG